MKHLVNLTWKDGSQTKKELKIINIACAKWEDIGILVGVDQASLEELSEKNIINSKKFRDVLKKWIDKGGTETYPATWMGLQTVLRDIEYAALAEKIKAAMPFLDL